MSEATLRRPRFARGRFVSQPFWSGAGVIPLFVGYAVVAWVLTCKHRRTLLGFAIMLASVALLVAIGAAHRQLGVYNPNLYIEGMQVLLYPYIVLVAAVGVFLVVLPHRPPDHCVSCGYSLEGLARPVHICPECGRSNPELAGHRRSGEERAGLRRSDAAVAVSGPVLADGEAHAEPHEQDARGDTGDERPSQDAQLARVERADQGDRAGAG